MPGPIWDVDHPADLARISANGGALIRTFAADAAARASPSLALVCSWHERLYDGCRVPSRQYLGGLRGDPNRPDLVAYEVGVGDVRADGWPDRVGVWSADVGAAVTRILAEVQAVLAVMDSRFPVGTRPRTVDELSAVVTLVAAVHGEWVRVHPFANGNGRTARAWAAWLALRYDLPAFVTVKPRPDDVAYARAGRASMGRPPDFIGDHTEAANVFMYLLALALLP